MSGNIKGITIEIGGETTKLDKALEGVNKKSRDLQSELKSVERLLKLDPSNTELVAQKQKLLTEAVSNTGDKLGKLKEAQKQAESAFKEGKIGEDQYRAIQREVLSTEQNLKSLEGQLSDVNNKWKDFADKASEVGNKTKDLGDKLAPVSAIAGAAGAGLIGLAVNAGQTADDINTLSKVTGVSVESLQKFSMASDIIDVSTETMAKGLAKLTKSMAAAKDGSKAQTEAFDKLKVSYQENGELRDNEDVFNDIIKSLGDIKNETERDALAFELFGKSAQDLNPLILGGADALKQIGDSAEAAGLIMSQDALDDINAFNDELDQTKAVAAAAGMQLGASVGEAMLPMLKQLAEGVQGLATRLKEIDPNVLGVILTILAIVAALAPLLIIIGQVITAVGTIGAALGPLIAGLTGAGAAAGVAGTATTALGGVLTALTGPVAIVVAAIAAIIASFIAAYKTNDEFKTKVDSAWKGIQNLISGVISVLKDLITGFLGGIKKLWDEHNKEVTAIVGAFWNMIVAIITAFIEPIIKVISLITNGISKLWVAHGEEIKKVAKIMWDGVSTVISGVLKAIQGIIKMITGAITGDWNMFGEGLKMAVEGIWKAITGIFTTQVELLKTIVKGGLDSVVGFFKNIKIPEFKIPLPHFKVNGSFSLNPPKVPSLDVDWYDKGGIFYGPQVIGVGEKRPEFVGALDDLKSIVAEVIAEAGTSGQQILNQFYIQGTGLNDEEGLKRLAELLYKLQERGARGNGIREVYSL